MPYVVIENFRHGLDGRRLNLTSVLGTLEVLQDGYINQGGEIEKRKAFVPTDITPTVASGVTATYGIQPLADSIVIFGAEENADEDNWPPAGFTYQRLYRDLAADAAADVCDTDNTPNYCAECEGWSDAIGVTDVIYSSSFGGKTFVIAEMSDGIVNCFYDGEIITDINAFGRRLTGMDSLLKLYCSWVKNLNGVTGYTGDIFDEAGELGILVTGTTHRRFHVLHPTTPGTICQASIVIADVSEPEIGLPGSVSSGFFTIFDGAPNGTTNQITSVKVGVTELLGSAVSFVGNVFDTATAVATEINAGVHAF